MTIAAALLLALFSGGLAHASRLCGIAGHVAKPRASAGHCSAHGAQPHDAAHPAERSDHARPACCAGGVGLAAIPAAKVQGAASTVLLDDAPGAVAASALDTAARVRSTPRPWSARDPGSGLRRHLACRVLLI